MLALAGVLAWAGIASAVSGPQWSMLGPGPRPPRGVEASPGPLGTPAPVRWFDDRYAFRHTQHDRSTRPVAYDPCRPIHYVTSANGAPVGGAEMVAEAFAQVSAITGLQFVDDGLTAEAWSSDRDAYQPERYGRRWAPVLVAWTTPEETPAVAGGVVGRGGSIVFGIGKLPEVYVTGGIVLDAPQMAQILGTPGGTRAARAVVLHEIGHLVGLDHVDDPTQLMYEWSSHVDEFGPGDLTGLAALGAGPCVPQY